MFKCFCWPSYDKNSCNKKTTSVLTKYFRATVLIWCVTDGIVLFGNISDNSNHTRKSMKKTPLPSLLFFGYAIILVQNEVACRKNVILPVNKFFFAKSRGKCIKVYNFLSLIYLCGIFYNHFLETVTEMHPLPFFLLRCQLLRGGHKKP